jgi:hypothetical protein
VLDLSLSLSLSHPPLPSCLPLLQQGVLETDPTKSEQDTGDFKMKLRLRIAADPEAFFAIADTTQDDSLSPEEWLEACRSSLGNADETECRALFDEMVSCVCVCVYMCVFVCLCVCVCVCVCVCGVCVCVCVYVHMYVYVCIYVHMYVTCVCIYVCIYVGPGQGQEGV